VPDSDPSGTLGSELSALWKKTNAEVKNAFTLSELQNGQAQTEISELTVGKESGILESAESVRKKAKVPAELIPTPKKIEKKGEIYTLKSTDKVKDIPYSGVKKPLFSPSIRKWIERGGTIEVGEDGTWYYTGSDGWCVAYRNGRPDFSEAGASVRDVKVAGFQGYRKDNEAAWAQSGLDKEALKKYYTWHHASDGETLQLIPKYIHQQFTHIGGMYDLKRTMFTIARN